MSDSPAWITKKGYVFYTKKAAEAVADGEPVEPLVRVSALRCARCGSKIEREPDEVPAPSDHCDESGHKASD